MQGGSRSIRRGNEGEGNKPHMNIKPVAVYLSLEREEKRQAPCRGLGKLA